MIKYLILFLLSFQCLASGKWYETDYVNHYCKGKIEYVLPDKARVDCLTDEYAIEYDYDHKWAEAIGQSLYYASATGKKAGIVLIVGKNSTRYLTRINDAIEMIPCNVCPAIKVWVVDEKQ